MGETEKNIARAFKESERDKSILFIDEADSLFINRETAVRSWETSQTNEILTWMENFCGVFICATNRLPEIDSAAMRRFHFKVTFKPMKKDQRLRLYRSFFSFIKQPVTKSLAQRVQQIDGLTPGDMKAVRERMKYQSDIRHSEIISALEEEQNYKGSFSEKIGF